MTDEHAADDALGRQRRGPASRACLRAPLVHGSGERLEDVAAALQQFVSGARRLDDAQPREVRFGVQPFQQQRQCSTHALAPRSLRFEGGDRCVARTVDGLLKGCE